MTCSLSAICAYPGMPDHTQLKRHDQYIASTDVLLHLKSQGVN